MFIGVKRARSGPTRCKNATSSRRRRWRHMGARARGSVAVGRRLHRRNRIAILGYLRCAGAGVAFPRTRHLLAMEPAKQKCVPCDGAPPLGAGRVTVPAAVADDIVATRASAGWCQDD